MGEEQEGRREFLRQFQAKSKAALAERVELEQQASQSWGQSTALPAAGAMARLWRAGCVSVQQRHSRVATHGQ